MILYIVMPMTHFEIDIVIAVVTGILAGVMSEIGSAGGLLALPMLIGMGLPPVVANATNRLGVFTVYTFAYTTYRRRGHNVALKHALIYAIPVVAGAVTGAFVAAMLSNTTMHLVIMAATVVMVLFTALGPELPYRTDATRNASSKLNLWTVILMMIVGFYAGFIEQAMAYLIFFVLVRVVGVEMETARGMKFFLSMVLTPFALAIFVIFGNVNWMIGLFLAGGSAIGGAIGALMLEKFSSRTIKIEIILSLILSLTYLLLFIIKQYIKDGITAI